MKIAGIIVLFILHCSAIGRTLEVGPFREYVVLQAAAAAAQPGDTILLYEAIHSGGEYIENLKGTAEAWITIRAAEGQEVIYRGNSQAFHLTDPAFVRIEGLIFEQQTGNGVNVDDGGTYETPAHHVIFEHCQWRSMNATGNNDELKLSGLDNFVVRNCRFTNGAAGGSLVDMVGCHNGGFEDNHFENAGSNCIQAKGGTARITIQRNKFLNGGERAVNIGGSTGLQFFRPIDANYEAYDILVLANIFIGATAPIAYVGAHECMVINNTIVSPKRWAVRILQETVDTSRFLPCGHNAFINNIVVFESVDAPAFNIGPNTAPETFNCRNNLWFHPTEAFWAPNTPVNEPGSIVGQNPLFADTLYHISGSSPARGRGVNTTIPERDYYNYLFPIPRSIGAVEYGESAVRDHTDAVLSVFPNPSNTTVTICNVGGSIEIVDLRGVLHWHEEVNGSVSVDVHLWQPGIYLIRTPTESRLFIKE